VFAGDYVIYRDKPTNIEILPEKNPKD